MNKDIHCVVCYLCLSIDGSLVLIKKRKATQALEEPYVDKKRKRRLPKGVARSTEVIYLGDKLI